MKRRGFIKAVIGAAVGLVVPKAVAKATVKPAAKALAMPAARHPFKKPNGEFDFTTFIEWFNESTSSTMRDPGRHRDLWGGRTSS